MLIHLAQPAACLLVPARRQNGAFVHQILQIGAAEAGGALGDVRQGDALRQLLVPRRRQRSSYDNALKFNGFGPENVGKTMGKP